MVRCEGCGQLHDRESRCILSEEFSENELRLMMHAILDRQNEAEREGLSPDHPSSLVRIRLVEKLGHRVILRMRSR